MDRTKIYIKMCEKAKKIQKDFPKNPKIGDCVYMKGYEYPSIVVSLDEYYDDETWKLKLSDDFAFENSRNLIWLPRQDQLQGMVIEKYRKLHEHNLAFKHLGDGYLSEVIMGDILRWADSDKKEWVGGKAKWWTSMEQLWLAFVMKEKYNKTWNGEDWIKECQI